MQYVPAQDHSAALIAWLVTRCAKLDDRHRTFVECATHVARLEGRDRVEKPCDDDDADWPWFYECLLTPIRADAWLREHVASEPMSLLRGVVL